MLNFHHHSGKLDLSPQRVASPGCPAGGGCEMQQSPRTPEVGLGGFGWTCNHPRALQMSPPGVSHLGLGLTWPLLCR